MGKRLLLKLLLRLSRTMAFTQLIFNKTHLASDMYPAEFYYEVINIQVEVLWKRQPTLSRCISPYMTKTMDVCSNFRFSILIHKHPSVNFKFLTVTAMQQIVIIQFSLHLLCHVKLYILSKYYSHNMKFQNIISLKLNLCYKIRSIYFC